MRMCTAYYGGHKKGCWKRLKYFLEELISEGHLITLVVSSPPKDLIRSDTLDIILIPISEAYLNKMTLTYFVIVSSLIIFFKNINKRYEKFLAFDCHNAVALSLPKLVYRTHLFLFIRGFYKQQDMFHSRTTIGKWYSDFINKLGYRLADRVRFASHANKGDMVREFGFPRGRIKVVQNNIIASQQLLSSEKIFANNSSNIVIGYLGQIVPRKNIGFLIEAVQQSRLDNIKLIIQGEGSNKELLKNYVKKMELEKKIIFKDWRNDISAFFSEIDVFVLPTHYDDSSNALIEAISAEKIVFASNRGGNIELLQNNVELLFCPLRGQLALARKFERIMNEDDYKSDIIHHIRKCKKTLSFDWIEEMKSAALIR